MIDWARVAELHDEIGAEDFDEIVELFLTEVEAALDSLSSAEGKADQLEPRLHFLKGSSLNLGFSSLASICQAGEFSAAAGSVQTIDIAEILRVYEASKTEFLSDLSNRLAA